MSGERWYELAFGPLYPVLYDHRDAEEARRAMAGFGEELASRQPVMDLACGAGRYLDVLHDSDTEAFGLDLSPTLLAMAAHSHTGRVARADMRFLPLRAGSVGAVISMFTSYGYFETDEENFVVLTEIERVLRPGGILLLDFFNAIPILRDPSRNSKRESGGFAIEEKRKISDDGRFMIKHVHAESMSGDERLDYEERVRAYVPEELESLVARSGLEVRERSGDYDRRPFDPERSDRLILVCEKPGGHGRAS